MLENELYNFKNIFISCHCMFPWTVCDTFSHISQKCLLRFLWAQCQYHVSMTSHNHHKLTPIFTQKMWVVSSICSFLAKWSITPWSNLPFTLLNPLILLRIGNFLLCLDNIVYNAFHPNSQTMVLSKSLRMRFIKYNWSSATHSTLFCFPQISSLTTT